ncbi:hypothetical protein ACVWXU_002007 [Streptomyces sp. TE33382]
MAAVRPSPGGAAGIRPVSTGEEAIRIARATRRSRTRSRRQACRRRARWSGAGQAPASNCELNHPPINPGWYPGSRDNCPVQAWYTEHGPDRSKHCLFHPHSRQLFITNGHMSAVRGEVVGNVMDQRVVQEQLKFPPRNAHLRLLRRRIQEIARRSTQETRAVVPLENGGEGSVRFAPALVLGAATWMPHGRERVSEMIAAGRLAAADADDYVSRTMRVNIPDFGMPDPATLSDGPQIAA